MESLVILVTILVSVVLLVGPLALILSYIKIIPDMIIWIMGLISISIGAYWFILPIPFVVKIPALLAILLGIFAIKKRS
jgi:hypothetical protein